MPTIKKLFISTSGSTQRLLRSNNRLVVLEGQAAIYNIITSLTNVTGSSSNPTTITQGGTAVLTFTAAAGYALPENVTVTGASYIWNRNTGTLGLSSPTGTVNVTIVGSKIDYLCFAANLAGSTVTFPQAFEYSSDGITWQTASTSTPITLTNVNDRIYVKKGSVATPAGPMGTFVMSGSIAASGNVMSLVDNTCESLTIPCAQCFYSLFQDCTALTTAPSVPATTLTDYCYLLMFYGCTNLTNAPALPATTLASYCYYAMFNGCVSLTSAPALPATSLTEYCYALMFYGCEGLVNAPALAATSLNNQCYYRMFEGCTALENAPALPATILFNFCYYGMFTGCSSLITAPSLPATTLTNSCYCDMFFNCTSLVNAPALPATTLADACYFEMFRGCTSLVASPSLPATTIIAGCYGSMFNGCTSLTTVPKLPVTVLEDSCYYKMFNGCTSLHVSDTSGSGHANAWRIPTSGTASGNYIMSDMFTGCQGTRSTDSPNFNGTSKTYYTQNTPV